MKNKYLYMFGPVGEVENEYLIRFTGDDQNRRCRGTRREG